MTTTKTINRPGLWSEDGELFFFIDFKFNFTLTFFSFSWLLWVVLPSKKQEEEKKHTNRKSNTQKKIKNHQILKIKPIKSRLTYLYLRNHYLIPRGCVTRLLIPSSFIFHQTNRTINKKNVKFKFLSISENACVYKRWWVGDDDDLMRDVRVRSFYFSRDEQSIEIIWKQLIFNKK